MCIRDRHRLVRTLDGIDLIELTPDIIHRQQAERQDHDYRIMLAICDLILQRRMPTEFAGQSYVSQLERDRLVPVSYTHLTRPPSDLV